MGPPETPELTERKDPLIGATLGSYVVKHWIGQGGMGMVYLAEQPDIGKAVAIKVLKPDVAADPEHLKRLVEEARTVNAIRHRGIIDIFGFGATESGRQYIVMEYLEGEPLDAYLARRGRLTPSEAVFILDEVLGALAAAHKAGVVHRDLKPGNIFFAMQSDGGRYVKVLDFGLAKKAQRPYGTAAQTQFRPIGTPEYMAPEQARGEPVGPRTDLYAIGVIAFEMLTGELPFNAPSLVEIMMKHMQDPPPSLRELDAAIPPALEALVLEMLAKQEAARPASAELIRGRLKQIARALAEAGTQIREVVLPESPPRPDAPTPPGLAPSPSTAPAGSPSQTAQTQEGGPRTERSLPPIPERRRWPAVLGAAAGVAVLALAVALWPRAKPVAEPAPLPPLSPEPPMVTVVSPPPPAKKGEEVKPVEPAPPPEPPKKVEVAPAPPPVARPPEKMTVRRPPKPVARPPVDDVPTLEALRQRVFPLRARLRRARETKRPIDPSADVQLEAATHQAEKPELTRQERIDLRAVLDHIDGIVPR